jgi:hypothetical protein
LNRQLPPGLQIVACRRANGKKNHRVSRDKMYKVIYKGGVFDEKRLLWFLEQPEWVVERTNKKGQTRTIDLRTAVPEMIPGDEFDSIRMRISSESGLTIRPRLVLMQVFKMTHEQCQKVRVIKEF